MEIALVETAERFVSALPDWKKLDEIPFDVSRMRLSTVHATPQGPTLFCKGAPEMVVPLCDRILADGEIRPLDSGLRTKVRHAQEAMAGQGLRVIAMSYRPLEDHWQRAQGGRRSHLRRTGRSRRSAPSRSAGGAAQMPRGRYCGHHGHWRPSLYRPGDWPRDRAHTLGDPSYSHGRQSCARSPTRSCDWRLDTPEIIFARVGADQKRRIVEALKEKGMSWRPPATASTMRRR